MTTTAATEGGAFPCPECGVSISVSVQTLLTYGALRCSACGLVLEVDQQKSARSVKLLRELEEGQKKVRDLKAESDEQPLSSILRREAARR